MTNRGGFTLLEMVMVMAVASILMAMAVPSFEASVYKPFFTTMKNDLNALVMAQEAFWQKDSTYTTALDSLHFRQIPGDSLGVIQADRSGYLATVHNNGIKNHAKACAVYVGASYANDAKARNVNAVEGIPFCYDDR